VGLINVKITETARAIRVTGTGRRARPIAELDLAAGAIRACPIAAVLAGWTGAGVGAGTGLAGAETRRRITVPATALFVRATAVTVGLTLGLGKGRPEASQTEDAANGRGSDGFEGLAAGSRSRQGLGQLVKAGRFHVLLVLSCAMLAGAGRCETINNTAAPVRADARSQPWWLGSPGPRQPVLQQPAPRRCCPGHSPAPPSGYR